MDDTEEIRRELAQVINQHATERAELEKLHGKVWDTGELMQDYEVLTFSNPLVVVKRRKDGVKGSLFFQGRPRFYFQFQEAEKTC